MGPLQAVDHDVYRHDGAPVRRDGRVWQPWEHRHPIQSAIYSNGAITAPEAKMLVEEIQRLRKIETVANAASHAYGVHLARMQDLYDAVNPPTPEPV